MFPDFQLLLHHCKQFLRVLLQLLLRTKNTLQENSALPDLLSLVSHRFHGMYIIYSKNLAEMKSIPISIFRSFKKIWPALTLLSLLMQICMIFQWLITKEVCLSSGRWRRVQPDLHAVIKAKDLMLKLKPRDDYREWMQELELFWIRNRNED